ncbi:MAG: ABC transporter substrate-binding protein, partial [Firmicutes bacterium]|nr:ABC transporter substrate-binding protein [Bacillota bacterium]
NLNVAKLGEYIYDGTDGSMDVIAEFEKLTGIKTNYVTYATNEELYAKMKAGAADYDIIIPSDYMISKMKNEDMLEKLDFSNIPNYEYIMDDYKNLEFDPEKEYSVPYFWGTVGIIYNTNLVDDEDFGWEILWDEKYADSILMFDNPRDAFAIAENMLGYSLNTEDEAELTAAAELLKEQKPLVQAYVMDEIFDKMGAEEAALAPYYAGDAVTLLADYDFLDFCVPESGTNMFVDSVCIPKGAANKQAAEMFINFLLEKQVGLANTDAVGYSTPNSEVYAALDAEVINDGISYPASEFLNEKTEAFKALTNGGDEIMSELWTEIRSE